MEAKNPFMVNLCGHACQTIDSTDRIRMVKQFTVSQCHAALKLDGLQKTVRQAIERRLRQLGKMGNRA